MQSKMVLRNPVRTGLAASLLLLGPLVQAEVVEDKPSVGAMVADVVLARPLYFVMSQAGALVYTATLPFSALGGNQDDAAEALAITPLQATFTRCLGCGKSPNSVAELKEGEGKTINSFLLLSGGLVSLDTNDGDGTDMGLGVYYGSHFALADKTRFDVMAGYKDFGTVDINTDAGKASESLDSIQVLTRIGRALDARSDLMFKVGMHRWSVDADVAGVSASANGYGFLLGLGLDHEIALNWRAGVDYSYYSMKKDSIEFDATMNTLDMTIGYYF
mgnify:CR=1 FL=1